MRLEFINPWYKRQEGSFFYSVEVRSVESVVSCGMGVLGEVSNWLRLRLRRSQPDSAEFEYWRQLFEDVKIRKLRSKCDDVQTWLENLETEEDEQDECSSDDLEEEDLGSATSWKWIPELNPYPSGKAIPQGKLS